ncbi:MAG: hypothetical protein ACK42G_08495, partial [Candidatus Kapaibacteriota bacterium]
VCKIIDYSKFKYEQKKKQKEDREKVCEENSVSFS